PPLTASYRLLPPLTAPYRPLPPLPPLILTPPQPPPYPRMPPTQSVAAAGATLTGACQAGDGPTAQHVVRRHALALARSPAAAQAAEGVPAARAAGPGVRRDRRRSGHVARRGPRPRSPRRQTTEGVPAVNMDEELQDARLRELARLLGSGAAERLDVERTAQAVVTRLRERPRVTLTGWVWMQPAWLKIAAVIALVLGAGVVTRVLLRERIPSALSH